MIQVRYAQYIIKQVLTKLFVGRKHVDSESRPSNLNHYFYRQVCPSLCLSVHKNFFHLNRLGITPRLLGSIPGVDPWQLQGTQPLQRSQQGPEGPFLVEKISPLKSGKIQMTLALAPLIFKTSKKSSQQIYQTRTWTLLCTN